MSTKERVVLIHHYRDAITATGYREKMEAIISSKLKGEAVRAEEKRPKKPVAKSMMEALRKTTESLK